MRSLRVSQTTVKNTFYLQFDKSYALDRDSFRRAAEDGLVRRKSVGARRQNWRSRRRGAVCRRQLQRVRDTAAPEGGVGDAEQEAGREDIQAEVHHQRCVKCHIFTNCKHTVRVHTQLGTIFIL